MKSLLLGRYFPFDKLTFADCEEEHALLGIKGKVNINWIRLAGTNVTVFQIGFIVTNKQ